MWRLGTKTEISCELEVFNTMPKAGMMGDVETMTEEQWMNQEKT